MTTWLESRSPDADFVDLVFFHKAPFVFLDAARELELDSIALSPGMAEFFLGHRALVRQSLDAFEEQLGIWQACHRSLLADVGKVAGRVAVLPLAIKGLALHALFPNHKRRFSVDVDLMIGADSVLPIAEELQSLGYRPHNHLRSSSDGAPSLLMRWGKRVRGCRAMVDVAVNYLDSYPRDYNALGGHDFLEEVSARAELCTSWPSLRIPDATDRLLWFLVEMTSNHILRLRDVLDLTMLVSPAGEIDWDRFSATVRSMALEPFWAACVRWLTEAGLAEELLPPQARDRASEVRYRRLAVALRPTDRPRILLRSTLPQSVFLYRTLAHQGRFLAAESSGKAVLRTLIKRFTGLDHARLLSRRWSRWCFFPRHTNEVLTKPWTLDDLRLRVESWSPGS